MKAALGLEFIFGETVSQFEDVVLSLTGPRCIGLERQGYVIVGQLGMGAIKGLFELYLNIQVVPDENRFMESQLGTCWAIDRIEEIFDGFDIVGVGNFHVNGKEFSSVESVNNIGQSDISDAVDVFIAFIEGEVPAAGRLMKSLEGCNGASPWCSGEDLLHIFGWQRICHAKEQNHSAYDGIHFHQVKPFLEGSGIKVVRPSECSDFIA